MKKKLLLPAFLLFVLFANAQTCMFTHTNAGTTNVFAFAPPASFPSNYRYIWSFGDGTSSADSTPVHAYNSNGTFIVCLTIYDAVQTLVCSSCDTLVVGNPSGGNCNFTYTVDTATNLVFITANPTSSTSLITWDFGDGNSGTGTPVSHTYASDSVYSVCMTETDALLGNVLCTSCDIINTGTISAVNCSFSTVADSVNRFLFYFSANVDTASTVTWTFNGGTTIITGLNVSHIFNSTGPYVVCMTSTLNGVTCTYCGTINPGTPAGNCTFSYSPNSFGSNSFSFTATPSMALSGILWDFGDGTTGQGNTTSHTYANAGTYTVCITEYNSGAIVCTSCINVTVNGNTPACQAYFTPVNLGLTGYFIDLSNVISGTATYSWDFGDGNSSTTRFTSHLYSLPGTYTVCLTLTDNGCTSQYCDVLTVDTVINSPGPCRAGFAIVQLAPYQFAVVNFSSGTNLNFSWDFGDGVTSNQPYPSHTYTTIGTYILCLTVTNSTTLCSSTFCDTLSVDSSGNVFRSLAGFTVNVLSPAQLVGVREISAPTQFEVYPNPVSSFLNVSIASDLKGITSYKVFAIDGSEVTHGTFVRNENRLNVQNWNQGAYILEVINSEGFRSYRKVIKE